MPILLANAELTVSTLTNAGCGPTGFASVWCFLGSTGLACKLVIGRASRSILTDVAADMPNVRGARITRETPVLRGARVARGAAVERGTPVTRNTPIARSVPTIPVVRARRLGFHPDLLVAATNQVGTESQPTTTRQSCPASL